jgi:hypothetical protein
MQRVLRALRKAVVAATPAITMLIGLVTTGGGWPG